MQQLANAVSMVLLTDPIIEYRVYYDGNTRECIVKTIGEYEGPYIVVTEEEYERIEFCSKYFVTKTNEIKKKPVDLTSRKLLQLSTAGYSTLPNNNIFASNSDACDFWSLKLNE